MFPDTLLNNWINVALAAWADEVFALDDTRFMKEGTIAVVSGTDSYDLKDNSILAADDYYRARGLAVTDTGSPSGYTRLDRIQWSERHDYSYSSHRLAAKWDVQGDDLIIWPKPTWSANLLLEYVPLLPTLVADGDTVDLRNNVAFVVLFVMEHLSPKDQSSKKAWADLAAKALGRLSMSSPQNKGRPKVAVSIYGDRRYRRTRYMSRLGT
jgi:hypothetical protein